ncbi:DUF1566 domain-containing protein [Aliiglaciecola litoralis]|uniref:Lcl C-terminal domain-containing protein n=1 Tax=Aliiglaciecola litoralis TaxID=582857 RepID=A0ABN1LJ30_9ALTE
MKLAMAVVLPFHLFRTLLLCAMSLWLFGCSGGSLDSDTDQPDPLVLVNAGANQTVNEQSRVVLNASAVGTTDTLTYSWSASPSLTIIHADPNAPAATFVAPSTTTVLSYTLSLVVTDGNGNQGNDTVQITVQPVNESPNALITVTQPVLAPQARYPAGVEVILSASASNDIDPPDTLNPIAAWRWQQTAGTDVLGSVSLDGDSLAFITPILDDASDLTFELTVTDQEGAQDTAMITLGVLSASQTQPLVNAGVDHQVYSGETIILTGNASTSIPAGLPLEFNWLNDSELVPFINNRSAEKTFAIAPSVTQTQSVTFTLSVTDSFGNVVDDSISVRIKPLPLSSVNDTGVMLQASLTENGTQHQADFPGQDGQRGRDIVNENNQLEKAGRGEQGFDFTRLDAFGDEQDDEQTNWSCVRDNNTGLVWEVKTTDTGLHSQQHRYSWLQATNTGGFPGVTGSAGVTCANSQCDTLSFVEAVNEEGLCNFFDWRLPTHNELLSLVHFGNVTGTKIDLDYFPNTNDLQTSPLWYWTSLPSADGVSGGGARTAWAIDFETGNDNFLNKATLNKVRLVRGGR